MSHKLMKFYAGDIGDLSVTDSLMKTKPIRAVYGILMMQKRLEFPLHNRFM
jgi:hypothetical protein